MSVQIHVQGDGPDLALLHGWGMTAAVWRELSAALAADFRVHAVEMPGYGIGAHASCDSLTAIVETLAAALPPSLTVCGWSLGGQVALAWARARPAQVERLILLATTPRFISRDDWAHGMAATEFEDFAGDVASVLPRARLRFLTLLANGDHAMHTVLRDLRAALARGGEADGDALAGGISLLREIDLRAELPQIEQPALVLHGVNDALIAHAAAEHLARVLPRAGLVSIEGAAHAVFVGRETMVAERIREFHGGR